ncbi:MAG: hypothetical protein NC543_13685 [bacterium]|nr:hypothetical protein [bacterium]
MKKLIYLFFERMYPYIFAFIFCIFLYKIKFNFINNSNIDNLIEGIITMESIVIGLIGAIIPVILSMKNESKFVKYVFENDTKGLFRKYLVSTIGGGLLSLTFSLSMYIRNEYGVLLANIIYYFWIFFTVLFLLLTYRSMKYMILIIFSPDTDNKSINLDLTQEEKNILRSKHKRDDTSK